MNIDELKKNPRTHYLALELERLSARELETTSLANEEGMAELAAEELKAISAERDVVELQIKDI